MIPSNLFTHDRAKRMFIAERSTIEGNCSPRALQLQVYQDACDVGFIMLSTRTGRESMWVEDGEIREDGELQVTIYKPTRDTLRRNPGLEGYTVHLLND